jgi:Fe2+ or Zn2+ uptake regulation protein
LVDEATKLQRLELFRQRHRNQGKRCTVQRQIILETVLELENHPTADQVHEIVKGRLPGIAKPTVYRTLEHLARMGIITKACHPGSVTRYDPRTEAHHHLVCLQCNQFVDFEDDALDSLETPDTSDLGFEVSDLRVQLRGVCRSCRESA